MHVLAAEICAALREELFPNTVFLVRVIFIHLLSPAAALHLQLLEKRFADGDEATLINPIGDGHDAALLKNVVSGVVPQLWDVFLPTCHVYVAAYDVQAMPVCISAGPQGVVEASSKAAGPATGFLAVMLLRWRLMTTKN